MDDQPTCGKGLAEHSALHAKVSALLDAMAENLERHLTSIDPRDEVSRPEHEAYVELAARHRELAASVRATGERMVGYRDLPMADHDEAALGAPAVMAAFERFVASERDLLTLMEERVRLDEEMLAAAREGAD